LSLSGPIISESCSAIALAFICISLAGCSLQPRCYGGSLSWKGTSTLHDQKCLVCHKTLVFTVLLYLDLEHSHCSGGGVSLNDNTTHPWVS
jgi:hypothetical protein